VRVKKFQRDMLQTTYHFKDIIITDWGVAAEIQN
jgi:beta-glucosidase-like glycosyl hydrolase